MSTRNASDPSRRLRIRSEADLLALVPYTFGFHPEESLVLVVLDRCGSPVLGRVDLPGSPEDLPDAVDQLVVPAVRHGGDRALVVVYSDDACLAEAGAAAMTEALARREVETLLALRADGSRWFRLAPDDRPPTGDRQGVGYDLSTHPLTSQAVLDGRITYRTREDLADSLVADPDRAEEVAAEATRLGAPPTGPALRIAEGLWLREQVAAQIEGLRRWDARSAARALRALELRDVRDLLWCAITRDDAEDHGRVWRELLRCSPPEHAAAVAGLLAFSAWLAGDGALAWCAVERCLDADPDHTLGRLVAQALDAALPPSAWDPVDPAGLGLFAG